jgi:hypothetical protein
MSDGVIPTFCKVRVYWDYFPAEVLMIHLPLTIPSVYLDFKFPG